MALGGDPYGKTEQKVARPRRSGPLRAGAMIGEYEVIGLLGEGGFGHVYHAVQPLIEKEVAIKVLKATHSEDEAFVSRFIAEARAVNKIGHPNIINIFSFGRTEDDRCYFVMDLLQGSPLKEYMQARGGRLAPADAVPLLRSIADALDAAHETAIVHRDLKPANVFVEDSGGIKLLDFGIAKSLSEEADYVTQTGAPIGTPVYMSPEQTKGRVTGASTDVYSLGVMTYQILTGKLPITGDNFVDIANSHANVVPPCPSVVRPALGKALGDAVMHMLEKDPADRPATAGAAIDALERALGGVDLALDTQPTRNLHPGFADTAVAGTTTETNAPSSARAAATSGATPTLQTNRSRAPLAIVAVAVLMVAVGAGYLLTRSTGESRAAETPAPAPTAVVTPDAAAVVAAPPPAPAAVPDAAPATPSTITLDVSGTPAGAIVYGPNNKRLGKAPGSFPMKYGDTPVAIHIRRGGYTTKRHRFTPNKDHALTYDLHRVRIKPPPRLRPRTNPTNKPKPVHDIDREW